MKIVTVYGILGILLLLFLGACSTVVSPTVTGDIEIKDLEMKTGETTNLTFSFNYKSSSDKPTDFKIDFFTGNSLTIYKNNSLITQDIIRDVSGNVKLNYQVRVSSYIREEQAVESITIFVTPAGSTLGYKFISDFILIKRG